MVCKDSSMLIKVRLSVYQLFVSFHFSFFVSFGDEVMKILRNLCLHFVRQDGQDGKKLKENHETKVTKIPNNALISVE